MRRREVIVGLVTTALPAGLPVLAKQPARIAVLGSGSKDAQLSLGQMTWLRRGLRAAVVPVHNEG